MGWTTFDRGALSGGGDGAATYSRNAIYVVCVGVCWDLQKPELCLFRMNVVQYTH